MYRFVASCNYLYIGYVSSCKLSSVRDTIGTIGEL